jgi:hypothetical protein
MKCMICGGQTLPKYKLCKPCRSALRRARDDTISELMPLPRRLDRLALQHARSGAGPIMVLDVRAEPKSAPTSAVSALARALNLSDVSPLRMTGAALIALAVATLAFVGTYQVRNETRNAAARDVNALTPASLAPRVSPASLAAAARETIGASESDVEASATAAPVAAPTPAASRVRAEPKQRRSAAASTAQSFSPSEWLAAFGASAETPAPSVAPIAAPAVPAPKLDRWQMLSAALAGCASPDLFRRASCENAARQQYCDGASAQHALCAGSAANDHGQ